MRLLQSIQFGPYQPDQPDLGNPGLELARNVLPRVNGYDSLPESVATGTDGQTAFGTNPVGAIGARDYAGNGHNYAGLFGQPVSGNLFELRGGKWENADRQTGGAYQSTERWEFAVWGDQVIATNGVDTPQAITMGGTHFADLTTDDVKGRRLAVVRSFLVLGYTDDQTDGLRPARVRWSGIDNPTTWAVSASTLSDFQDLRTKNGGDVMAIVGGEYGIVFQERSISRMTFVGSPGVFQFDEVDPGIGTIAPGSVIQHGARTFFWSADGIRMTQGDQSVPVGEEKIDLSVYSDLDLQATHLITGAVYTNEQIVVWAYPGAGHGPDTCNRLLVYNYATDRWAVGDEAVLLLYQAASNYTPLEDLDNTYVALEDIPGSLDDDTWAGGAFSFAGFGGTVGNSKDLIVFTGAPRSAQLESGEMQLTPGRRTFISEMRSQANLAGGISVEIGYRASQADPVVWTPPISPTAEGFIPVRNESRYHRFRVTLTGGFDHAVGLNVFGEPAGGR